MSKFYRNAVRPLCLCAALLAAVAFSACSKKDKGNGNSGNGNGNNGSSTGLSSAQSEDSLRYLMYRNMQVDADTTPGDKTDLPGYYWYKSVPTIDPYASTYANADSLLEAMKRYAINPGTGAPYDRYSFLDRDSTISSQLQNGHVEATKVATGDFGLEIAFAGDKQGNVYTFVLYADKNSPAGKAGITRGMELTSVNGITNFNTTSARQNVVNAIYSTTTGTLSLGIYNFVTQASSNTTLTAAAYDINPILFDTIFNSAKGKVGYFAFYTFTNISNSKNQPSLTKQLLDAEFAKMKAANVTNMIVDLRNNGGGSVATAEYLDSALAPASAANQIMYYTSYNDKLNAYFGVSGNGDITKFPAQTGGMNLQNMFFMANEYTASAAELTINNLKPYMNVKLVADTNTYGKPVGFFGAALRAHVNNKLVYLADLYAINFETKNANLQGGYYGGLVPDYKAIDFVDVAFGDTQKDLALAGIMNYINTGSFPAARLRANTDIGDHRVTIPQLNNKAATLRFNGMIDFRRSKK